VLLDIVVRPTPEKLARQNRQKGQVEFQEGTQHYTQGPRDRPVGKFRQHFMSIPRGMYWYILVYICMYLYIFTCNEHVHVLNSMPMLRISRQWQT
jgi:hypothetical protein